MVHSTELSPRGEAFRLPVSHTHASVGHVGIGLRETEEEKSALQGNENKSEIDVVPAVVMEQELWRKLPYSQAKGQWRRGRRRNSYTKGM